MNQGSKRPTKGVSMKAISCVEYSESNQVLAVVFQDGTHECYFAKNLKSAWDILRDKSLCADIRPTRSHYEKDNQKSS